MDRFLGLDRADDTDWGAKAHAYFTAISEDESENGDE